MARLLKRRLALAVAALALMAGGTAVALGASGSSARGHARHPHAGAHAHGLLAAAAAYLGIPVSQLRSRLSSGETLAQVAAATPGRTEAGLISALVAAGRQRLQGAQTKLPARVQALVQGQTGGLGRAGRRGHSLRDAAAAYLGLDRRTLAGRLHAGETLAQIAQSTPGKSPAGLRGALLTVITSRLDAKLAAGTLTKTAAAHRLRKLESRLDRVLTRSFKGLARRSQTPPA